MTRQEAEQAVKKFVEQEIREGDELLDAARIDFKEEDERCFYFSSGDCEIGVFKDSGIVEVVPTESGTASPSTAGGTPALPVKTTKQPNHPTTKPCK